MKKMVLVMGMVFVLFCATFMTGCKGEVDIDAINEEGYEMAIEKAHNLCGDDVTIRPRVTRDGIVESYKVLDADGEVIAFVDLEFK